MSKINHIRNHKTFCLSKRISDMFPISMQKLHLKASILVYYTIQTYSKYFEATMKEFNNQILRKSVILPKYEQNIY